MKSPSQDVPIPIGFRAGLQARKVVALTAFAAACALGAAWWGLDIGQSWGLAEADGGVLKPLWQRTALGGGLALLGIAGLAGMLLYWRHYIVALDLEDGGRTLRIGRLAPYPALRLPVAEVRIGSKVHTGHVGGPSRAARRVRVVDAPWRWVRVPGWRWPLVLDLRGQVIDTSASASGSGG